MIRKPALKLAPFAFAACSISCVADSEQPATGEPNRTPAQVDAADPLPPAHPPLSGLDIQSRGSRRLSVPQMLRSIETFGRLENGSLEIPIDLAITLGQPDYLQTTEESLDPSPLFMKFMMDLAGLVCRTLAAIEPERTPNDRVFTRFGSLEENLRDTLLMATGIHDDDATPYVDRLTRVYNAARQGPRGEENGHEAVCIALLTSPEFLLY